MWMDLAAAMVLALGPVPGGHCFIPPPPAEEMANATAVFTGRVVGHEWVPTDSAHPTEPRTKGEVLVFTLEILQAWKGDPGPRVRLFTMTTRVPEMRGAWDWAEDVHFEDGESYLVYAFGAPDRLYARPCGRTSRLPLAEMDLRALGPPLARAASR